MAHYTGSAIACSTAGNVNYFPQQNIVHSGSLFVRACDYSINLMVNFGTQLEQCELKESTQLQMRRQNLTYLPTILISKSEIRKSIMY